MTRTLALIAALVITSQQVEARTMVEQFYVDASGNRVSRGTNHSPIAYGPQDQMHFFLGHFGYVDNSQLYRYNNPWGNWVWGLGTTGFLGDFSLTPADLPKAFNEPTAVSEPRALAIFLISLMVFGVVRSLTAKRSAL